MKVATFYTSMDAIKDYANQLVKEIKQYGKPSVLPKQIILKAGKLTMVYEAGNLRYISLGDVELVRMIYSAVRDKAWLTLEPQLNNEQIDIQDNSFLINYDCRYQQNEIDFLAHFTIEGRNDNSLIFKMEGEALSTFQKNRIGFCILHPIETCAGFPCQISHYDGTISNKEYPKFISPDAPFKDIQSMKWSFSKDLYAELNFKGDIFETEDHRNWTDASFKTYCTPLSIPYPVTIEKGTRITQSVEFKVDENLVLTGEEKDEIDFVIDYTQKLKLPKIGIGRTTRPQPLTQNEADFFKNLPFDHYRADIYLFDANWENECRLAIEESEKLGYQLEFALFFDEKIVEQANVFISLIQRQKHKISNILIFHRTIQSTPDYLSSSIIPVIRKALPGITIACGTNANFAQLNRSRPQKDLADALTFSIQPQEHAFDNLSLVENLKAQAYAVENCKQFAHNQKIFISPITIQRRFNANFENYEHPAPEGTFPSQVDSRIMSLFGACWTTGSLKYLCESGVDSITYYETVGERGICMGEYNSRWPENFYAIKNMVFPLYHVFKYLLGHKDYQLLITVSSKPLQIDGFAVSDGKNVKLVLANFTSIYKKIKLIDYKEDIEVLQLHTENFASVISDPDWLINNKGIKNKDQTIELQPFGICIIE